MARAESFSSPLKITFRCPPELTDVLPQPCAAKRGLPDWLKPMAASAPCDDVFGEIRTVKQCPPFLDAMAFRFIMPLTFAIALQQAPVLREPARAPSRSPSRASCRA